MLNPKLAELGEVLSGVTKVELFLAGADGRNFTFAIITTEEGIAGWGEATPGWKEYSVHDMILDLGRRNPGLIDSPMARKVFEDGALDSATPVDKYSTRRMARMRRSRNSSSSSSAPPRPV